MKKFMLISSLMLCFGSIGLVGDFFSDDAGDTAASNFMYASNSKKRSGGNANHILDALEKEYSKVNMAYMDKDQGVFGSSGYLNPLAYGASFFHAKKTQSDIDGEETRAIDKIEAYYQALNLKDLDSDVPTAEEKGVSKRMSSQIEKDMQALEELIAQTKYPTARKQLESYLNLADHARAKINKEFTSAFKKAEKARYKIKIEQEPIAKVLKEAQRDLADAQSKNNQVAMLVYPQLIQDFKSIEKEVKKFVKDYNDDFDEAIVAVEELLAHENHDNKQALYKTVIAQLKMDKGVAEGKENAPDKVALKTKSNEFMSKVYVADDNNPLNNPIEGLARAEASLKAAQAELIINQQHYGVKSQNKVLKAAKLDVEGWIDAVSLLKAKVSAFEVAVNAKIAEKIQVAHGDKKKALQALTKPSGYQYAKSFIWTQSTENQLINKIANAVDKEAAKRLQKQIKEESLDDPEGAARAKLEAASSISEYSSAYNELAAAKLEKNGMSLSKLPSFAKTQFTDMVSESSQKMVALANDRTMPESKKTKAKAELQEETIVNIAKLLSPYLTNLDLDIVATGDTKAIAFNAATNKMVNSLLVGQ